jgi:hypothetical protein
VNQESRQFTFAPDARSDLRASVLRNAFSPQPKYPRLRVASQFTLPNRALPETRIGDFALIEKTGRLPAKRQLSCEHDVHRYREMGFRHGSAETSDPT